MSDHCLTVTLAGKNDMAIPVTLITEKRGSDSLDRMVRLLVANHTPEELALGYLRYEAVRKMSPHTFGELHKLNLSGKFFDSLVDEALQSWKQPNAEVRHGGPDATN